MGEEKEGKQATEKVKGRRNDRNGKKKGKINDEKERNDQEEEEERS